MAGMDREGGAFFSNSKKQTPNAPDFRGEMRLSREVIENLNQQLQAGVQFPAIELSGWKKTSNSGTTYISMSGRKPYVKGDQNQQQRQAPQGGWGGSSGQSSGWSPSKGNALEDDIPFSPEWR